MTAPAPASGLKQLQQVPGWRWFASAFARARGRRSGGRNAAAPTAIPARGWLDIALRTLQSVMAHDVATLAAGVTFYVVLALIPGLSAAAALYVLFADERVGLLQALALQGLAPDSTLQLIAAELGRIAKAPRNQLAWIALGGSVAAAGSLNAAVLALFRGLNVAYQEEECRPFLRRTATSAAFTGGTLLSVVAVTALLLGGRQLAGAVGATPVMIVVTRFTFLALAAGGALALVYRYGPCRALPKWRWVTPGGALAALTWLVSSAAVSYYLEHFAQYERSYGLLGAMLATVVWLWTATTVVLLGAELNCQIEAQTDRNTSANRSGGRG